MDGLEKELAGRAKVIRLSLMSATGVTLAKRYGVRMVPAFIVLDKKGKVIMSQAGFPNKNKLAQTALQLI